MTYDPNILVDSGILVAYYSVKDNYHEQVKTFFEQCTSELITTIACVTEMMYLLQSSWQTQNEFLNDLAIELYRITAILPQDLQQIDTR